MASTWTLPDAATTSLAQANTTSKPEGDDDGVMIGRTASATLSPESRRRSNIFGILHSEAPAVDPASPHHLGSPSSRSNPARMSVDSLVHRGAEQGQEDTAVLRDGTQKVVSPSTFPTLEDRLISDMTQRRSASPSKEQSDRLYSQRPEGTVLNSRTLEESGSPPTPLDQGVVDMEIVESERRGNDHEHDERAEQQQQNGHLAHGSQLSSGEEDEGEIDGAIDADPEGEGEEDDDEEEEEDSDDDDDDEGSIDLEAEQDDVGDSPVFISMRNGPLGISDLLLPPAAGGDEIRVKAEPGQEDFVQSQTAGSDVVVLGSRAPSQEQTSAHEAGGPMDVISIEDNSQNASINGAPSTENQSSAVVNQAGSSSTPNVLVPRPAKKKRARAKSPSPPPAPPPKPRKTIRVVFNLFNDDEGPDGTVINTDALDGLNEQGPAVSAPAEVEQGDVSMLSTPGPNQPEAPVSTEQPATPKPAEAPAPREEPKYRVVNFKQASLAQGKVDSDYYIANSGWNAIETDDDDEADDDMDVDGVPAKGSKTNKRIRELLTNGTSGTTSAMPTPGGNGDSGPSVASGPILHAVMDGSDEAELARLAEELDKKYSVTATAKPKRKRVDDVKNNDYDYKDPFIDDSDLQVDEPMIMHRPAKEGFYVQKGAVELISDDEDVVGKKAKGKKQTTLNFGKITPKEPPTDYDVPLGEQPKKRKKLMLGRGFRPMKIGTPLPSSSSRPSISHADSGKGTSSRASAPSAAKDSAGTQPKPNGIAKQTSPDVTLIADPQSGSAVPPPAPAPVGPPLTVEEALSRLPEEIHPVLIELSNMTQSLSNDEWKAIRDAKKFPESFKPLVYEVGKKAVELGLVGDTLYDALPLCIRYNRFTMKKYILDRMKDYQAEYYEKVKKELLPVLKTAIDNTMDKQVTDYTTLLDAYQTSVKNEEDSARREGREKAELTSQPPLKRIRWSDEMRQTFWRLVKAAENEGRFEAQQSELHGKSHPSSSAFLRRNELYSEIVPLFPDGWMSVQQLSRQMSSLKTRYERQAS